VLLGVLAVASSASAAGSQAIPAADSALVGRILIAEDARDATSPVFTQAASANERIRLIAQRALARIRDAHFAARDSLPAPVAPPHYDDAPWRVRYRELGPRGVDCAIVERAFHDREHAVVLRAIDVLTPECASEADRRQLRDWTERVPSDSRRRAGMVGWQAQVHALITVARILPNEAGPRVRRFATSPVPAVRVYAARAAALLRDTSTLRTLARDRDDNVKEAAIDALSGVAGHAADTDYIDALGARGYQVVRAAARALKGTTNRDAVLAASLAAMERLRRDSSETSRDARLALFERVAELAGATTAAELDLARDFDCDVASTVARRFGVAPYCRPLARRLPAEAIGLALGEEVLLRVTLADSSGGGHFDVRLRGDVAPITAGRVLALARAGAYDNHAWYRVEPDFVIQGGGPGNNEYVGFPQFIRDELSAVPQVRGTVGMSTRGHDTGDGQWFINLRDNLRLTRDYTTFGEVVDGIDVVDGILEGDVIARIEPITAPEARRSPTTSRRD
jgi:cyclophilin family peptidyl-prolyl cis-trans isomerase